MLRIGVDMVEVERIRAGVERFGERYFARFFTATEREQSREVPARLAARFAAKEAAAKALGTGIGDVSWLDIEIESDTRGRPHLKLHNAAARLAEELGLHEWQVSLSHTQEHAIAFVVALGVVPSREGE
ncbi:MAG: holo-ACP synthase [Anaerolineae bacterium]|nr:holo-ACP synthase [Anaerolineae bacterium]